MSRETLAERVFTFADAVQADWRWADDDLNVSVLGMLLYGVARSTARNMGLSNEEADAVVLKCLTDRVGAAAKWSSGLVTEARLSADSKAHHPGNHELVAVGESYHGVADLRALVDNAFANFASVRKRTGIPEQMVTVFVNPLAMLLAGLEQKKGTPLTEAEVLKVRDEAVCTQMPLSNAEQFYAAMDARVSIPRLNPERIWEEWQAARGGLTNIIDERRRWWQFWR